MNRSTRYEMVRASARRQRIEHQHPWNLRRWIGKFWRSVAFAWRPVDSAQSGRCSCRECEATRLWVQRIALGIAMKPLSPAQARILRTKVNVANAEIARMQDMIDKLRMQSGHCSCRECEATRLWVQRIALGIAKGHTP